MLNGRGAPQLVNLVCCFLVARADYMHDVRAGTKPAGQHAAYLNRRLLAERRRQQFAMSGGFREVAAALVVEKLPTGNPRRSLHGLS